MKNAIKPLALCFMIVVIASLVFVVVTPAQNVLPANAATTFPNSDMSSPSAHALEISGGDLLEVSVFDTPELSGRLRVDEHGDLSLPLAGQVRVSGLTAEKAAREIEGRFQDKNVLKDPHVSVTVLEYDTQGVTVAGEVKNPGVYPLLGAHDLLDLISKAGGLTGEAGSAVTITHRDDVNHPIVTKMGSQPGATGGINVDIRPGDTIVVSHTGIVYVVGDVVKPGGFLIGKTDRLTVLQAVALAQGTNKTAALNQTKVIRRTAAGREEIAMPLKKIFADKAPDQLLADGDILFVPTSTAKSALHGIEDVLPGISTAAIYRVP